tara:strand:+ start:1075 stop:2739 length:1665 start_codon:yes stop_codon:yes gene_type:complete
MDFINKLFKNKNFVNLLFGVIFFVLVLNFPFLLLIITPLIIIVGVFSDNTNNLKKGSVRKKKLNNPKLQKIVDDLRSNDLSKIKGLSDKLPGILEDVKTPKTFFDVIGDLAQNITIYYTQEMYDLKKKRNNEDLWILDNLENSKKTCDEFFDGNEYIKYWTIYRTLEKRGVSEERIYQIFPNIVQNINDIRSKNWEDVAWSFFIAETVEKERGEGSCTKDLYLTLESVYLRINKKEEFFKDLVEGQKDDYKLLLELDLEVEKEKEQKIYENFVQSFPKDISENKPKKIKSIIKLKLEDAIELGEKVRESYSDYPVINAFDLPESGLRKRELEIAGFFNDKKHYESMFGKDFVENIQDMDIVSDFYRCEMFDKDPILTAINNKDIERIVFYSLIQIPRQSIKVIEEISQDDPVKRAPYFALLQIHTLIIVHVLSSLGIIHSKEEFIKTWVLNQITDPLDQGQARDDYLKNEKKGNRYDDRFTREIWMPLYKSVYASLISSETDTLYGSEFLVSMVDSYFITTLKNYFFDDPESVYEQIKPMSKAMDRIFGIEDPD